MNTIKKRSVKIAGHTTSISLESEFWQVFGQIAQDQGVSINVLATQIDQNRDINTNLSSAIRIYILQYLQSKLLTSQ